MLGDEGGGGPLPTDVERFEAAWGDFVRACAVSEMPEATYQAWFAHFLIERFGLRHVVREPSFGIKRFVADAPDHPTAPLWRARLTGQHIRLDVVILRSPEVAIPQWISREREDHIPGGLGLIPHLAVVSELKIASTQRGSFDPDEVCRDIWKLSALLAEARHLELAPLPTAFVCVLDNHPTPTRVERFSRRLASLPPDPAVRVLAHTSDGAPVRLS